MTGIQNRVELNITLMNLNQIVKKNKRNYFSESLKVFKNHVHKTMSILLFKVIFNERLSNLNSFSIDLKLNKNNITLKNEALHISDKNFGYTHFLS